ncbi:DNA-damage-inducible gene [Agrilactobacillus composti DSM 18527 = JCM 14202]|uniref:type II toxin-antitoxin system RelB/DinJ family antitoxin n=1 Tax=Agrilactobacillus composti TaxID=398555 RepID=UPI00042E0536|nr:type II toxin-antitoxin system RelB/DinJ family antitoxin [Agrilactobacillus composti]GAF38612.1 DNA-damage-inducible gene [Agrilactobacillus composti DSM 18527 = JCM 14202]
MAIKDTKKRLNVNLNESLYEEGNAILDQLGLSPSTVVTALYKRIVAEQGIPFKLALTPRETVGNELAQTVMGLPAKPFKNKEEIQKWLANDENW